MRGAGTPACRVDTRVDAFLAIRITLPDRSVPKQIRQFTRSQKGESAAVFRPPQCQASIAIDPMPAEVSGIQPFARHRLHRVAEECLDPSDLDHVFANCDSDGG